MAMASRNSRDLKGRSCYSHPGLVLIICFVLTGQPAAGETERVRVGATIGLLVRGLSPPAVHFVALEASLRKHNDGAPIPIICVCSRESQATAPVLPTSQKCCDLKEQSFWRYLY